MKNGIQTNFPHEELRIFGCYFFTLLKWADLINPNSTLSDDDIISIFNICKDNGWIGDKCFINNPVRIINYLCHDEIFRDVEHSNITPNTEYFPVLFRPHYKSKGSPPHFALGTNGSDRNGEFVNVKIIFDSWEPSAEQRGMILHNYRSFS